MKPCITTVTVAAPRQSAAIQPPERPRAFQSQGAGGQSGSDRIVIAGGTGFLGRVLATHLQRAGYACVILTRSPNPKSAVPEIHWDGRTPADWTRELEGAYAVINLTGRSVNCRYHERNRRLILDSRVEPTRVLGQAIAQCKTPPTVWLNASTATIYKHNFGPAWDEAGEIRGTPEARDEFSVSVATAWENALNETATPRTRKIALRSAMVLGTGANSVFPVLKRMVRLGLGGKIADGQQFVSWIHEADFCRAVEWLMTHPEITGPVNLCAPNPLTNDDMMKTLRAICKVPFGLPATRWMMEIGAFVLRTESELVIKSRRVIPQKLLTSGFEFQFSIFRAAAENLIGQMGRRDFKNLVASHFSRFLPHPGPLPLGEGETLPAAFENQRQDWSTPHSKKEKQT